MTTGYDRLWNHFQVKLTIISGLIYNLAIKFPYDAYITREFLEIENRQNHMKRMDDCE